jgi:hypothetical protein
LLEQAMKAKLPFALILSLLLSAAVLAACATNTDRRNLYGYPEPITAYGRAIIINPDTKFTVADTVQFAPEEL